jgi:hemerythrin-like domain-containing protein
MDAFELLKTDHKNVADLFEKLETATGKGKIDVFKRIKAELELHTHLEEAIFYPALEKPQATHDLTLEAYEEHKVVKSLLAELSGAKSADDEWQAKAKVLRENVEHHVEEEENELFDKASDALSEEEIQALGDRMAAEKAKKQGRPEPKTTGSKKAKDKAKSTPSLITRVANLIGLGGGATKKATKKSSKTKKERSRPEVPRRRASHQSPERQNVLHQKQRPHGRRDQKQIVRPSELGEKQRRNEPVANRKGCNFPI